MKRILTIAAAAATIAACHSQKEDQVGATPARDTAAAARGDTAAPTHAIDTTRTGPPGEAGRPGNATVNVDSVVRDTTHVRDSTSNANPQAAPQDTLGPRNSGQTDTTHQNGATEMHADSTSNR
jgi:PBP1b-binding outer membrane lipoprotein LpoB